MKLNGRFRGYGIVAAALVVSACADNSTAPASISSISNRSAHSVSGSTLHSNDTQYRAQTVPYQSNRSGSATLMTRALLGKDGKTVLEVTTGQLDAPSAPGSISKLQEKLLTGAKALFATKNFNGLTGPVQTLTFDGLQRYSFIQTQGNVGGIDGKRTDVVTVTERVNLRPDLAVVAVAAPDKSKPGQTFIVTANVKEMNGDVGAYDNCVLYVDGTEAGRVNHQWVADGDMVNCVFETSIAAVGTHTLEVRSENVVPGDWDMSNNSASRTIEIVNPEIVLHGHMTASDYDYKNIEYNSYTYTDVYGRDYGSSYEFRNLQRRSQMNFYSQTNSQAAVGNVSSVDLTVTSGGTEVASIHASNLNNGTCSYTRGDNYATWLHTCTLGGNTYVTGGMNSGSAVYYEYSFGHDNYECYNDGYCYGDSWSYGPYSSSGAWGSHLTFDGNDVTMSLRVEGIAGTALVANASLTLSNWYNSSLNSFDQPLTCTDTSVPGSFTARACVERHYSQKYRNGSVAF